MAAKPDEGDLGREVDQSMRMFERSQVGPAASFAARKPARVLWVLDGSPQDEAASAAAAHLQETFDSETLVLDARDHADGQADDLAPPRAAALAGARPLSRRSEQSYDAILAAVNEESPVDLVIVPCPFGRSFEDVGADSAGTVIDVLLSRCPRPMLVIRRDDQRLAECAQQISMIVGSECDVENRAASWAFGLAAKEASITLNLVIEKEQYENIRSILEALDPNASLDSQQFSDALTKTHQALHGAMAKTASERGLRYALRAQAGAVAPPNPLDESSKLLMVMPLEVDDRFGQGFVQDRIRRSPHPVLVVPGHVEA